MTSTDTDLTVRRTRRWIVIGWVVIAAGAVGLAAWYVQHPEPLPTASRTVNATTPVAAPVYIGMANGIEDRTLHLSGVKVLTTSNTDLDVVPLLCRAGRIEATSDPTSFCSELVDPEGQAFGPQDSIVLEVTSDVPAVAVIDPVRLGFRDGLQWGTFPTGADAIVRVLAR